VTKPDVAGTDADGLASGSGGASGVGGAGGLDRGSDTGWLRLSPRSLVVRPLTDLVRLLPLLAGLLILHSRTGSSLIWGVLASVAAVVTGLVHWITTRYRITDERVYMRRGLLSTKVLSVARDRIRTVDVTARLLHRMLGVCRVSIGTRRELPPRRPDQVGCRIAPDGAARWAADRERGVSRFCRTTAR
jgi:putative membrane protein